MKAAYQRNMVIGQIVATILIVLPMWILTSFSTTPESRSRQTIKNIRTIETLDKLPRTLWIVPPRRNVPNRPRTLNSFRGQIGAKITIIPDNNSAPRPVQPTPEIYSLDLTPVAIDDNISVSDLYSGDTGAYLPEDAFYTFDNEPDVTAPVGLTRAPVVIHRVRPDIPITAVSMGIGGEVDVLMLIDPTGRPANFAVHALDTDASDDSGPEFILDVVRADGSRSSLEFYIDPQKNDLLYVTLKDDPADFKFAKYLHQVLPEWRFSPALREGIPVYCFVHIHYCFCAPGDEDCSEITLSTG